MYAILEVLQLPVVGQPDLKLPATGAKVVQREILAKVCGYNLLIVQVLLMKVELYTFGYTQILPRTVKHMIWAIEPIITNIRIEQGG